MIRAFLRAGDPTWLRPLMLALLLTPGCTSDNSSPVAQSDSPGAPAVGSTAETATQVNSSAVGLASVTYTGIPYGPFGLWTMNKLNWGPGPFTASHNFINADTLVLQINAARNKGQRLLVAMTGGDETRYTTNGQFDMTKWKNVMSTYNKSSLKTAVAAAVSDGTLIGNLLIDEPSTKRWGTVLTKPMIDQMAVYAKSIFPTLPVGVNYGPQGYKWRTSERYTKVDYVLNQYNYVVTSGNIVAWRDAVLAQAKLDGVTPAMSLNVLGGGVQDYVDGYYNCTGTGQGGIGAYTSYPNCQMTPDQVRTWGTALTPYGCFMSMWRYDKAYMSKTANLDAFKAIAALAASKPRRSCKRP